MSNEQGIIFGQSLKSSSARIMNKTKNKYQHMFAARSLLFKMHRSEKRTIGINENHFFASTDISFWSIWTNNKFKERWKMHVLFLRNDLHMNRSKRTMRSGITTITKSFAIFYVRIRLVVAVTDTRLIQFLLFVVCWNEKTKSFPDLSSKIT